MTNSLTYTVFYEAAPEGGFVALVPALPGCHSLGDTIEEAEANIREAIELYLETLTAHGDPVPTESRAYQGKITVPFLRTA